ncbi:MAG: YkvA family protein [bacterium]
MGKKQAKKSGPKRTTKTEVKGRKSAPQDRKAASQKATKRARKPSTRKSISQQRAPTAEERKQLKKDRTKAKGFARDRKKAGALLDEALRKANRQKGSLAKVWDELMTLSRLVRAWVKREYEDIPWETLLWILAAVIYFVNPFDAIPDFLPGVGYIDDAALIAWVIRSFRNDIDQFRDWEAPA